MNPQTCNAFQSTLPFHQWFQVYIHDSTFWICAEFVVKKDPVLLVQNVLIHWTYNTSKTKGDKLFFCVLCSIILFYIIYCIIYFQFFMFDTKFCCLSPSRQKHILLGFCESKLPVRQGSDGGWLHVLSQTMKAKISELLTKT